MPDLLVAGAEGGHHVLFIVDWVMSRNASMDMFMLTPDETSTHLNVVTMRKALYLWTNPSCCDPIADAVTFGEAGATINSRKTFVYGQCWFSCRMSAHWKPKFEDTSLNGAEQAVRGPALEEMVDKALEGETEEQVLSK